MGDDYTELPLAIQQGKGASSFVSAAELRNLMFVRNPPGAQRAFSLLNTPGLVSPLSPTGPILGIVASNSYLYWIQNGRAYFLDSSVHDRGAIATGAPYEMCVAPSTEALATSVAGTYLIGSSVTSISHPEVGGQFIDVDCLNGKALYVDTDRGRLYVSNVDAPQTIGALAYTTADAIPDSLIGVAVCNQEAALFGLSHTEFWYDAGASPFPLARSPSGVAHVGCISPHTIAVHDHIYFLDRDFRVRRFIGYQAEIISNEWVEKLIRECFYGNINIRGHVHTFAGKTFYGLSFPSSSTNTTLNLFYEIATGLWHRRDNAAINSSVADNTVFSGGIVNVGSLAYQVKTYGATAGKVYEFSETDYRDVGATTDKSRTIVCPAHEANGKRVFDAELELLMERTTGVTGTVTQSFSDDGGASYHSQGSVATDQERKRWHRNGSYRRRIRKLVIAANARIAIDGLRARLEVGT